MSACPAVSVIVASYNMGQYLPMAIGSILAGSFRDIEVIVVDDGSTDGTPERIQPLLADARLRYIRQENLGQPRAKNRGLREAKGGLIAFCDADDLWKPEKLALQLPRFADPDVGVVYSEVSFIDETGRPYTKPPAYRRHSGRVTDQLLLKNFVPFGTAVFRRECMERAGVFDERFRMGIDWDLWLRYSLDWAFAYVPECTYVYREWPGQMSSNFRGRYEFAQQILENFEREHGGKVSRRALRKAWADIYVSRAHVFAKNEKTSAGPLRDVLRGLAADPLNVTGWKVMAKILLRWYR